MIGLNPLWNAVFQPALSLSNLGAELIVLADGVIQDAGGSSGAWNPATGEFSNSVAGTSANAPRIRFQNIMEIGKTYQVTVSGTGDTNRLFRAGGNNWVDAVGGVIDGTFEASNATFQVQGDGQFIFSMNISISLREVL